MLRCKRHALLLLRIVVVALVISQASASRAEGEPRVSSVRQ